MAHDLRVWILVCLIPCSFCQDPKVEFFIDEEVPPGTRIGRISATNFEVTDLENASQLIDVNTDTGVLRVRSRIDRDTFGGNYVLNFLIIPSGEPPYLVAVNINDINDNAPVFPKPYLEFTVSESVTDEFQHALGTANDPDQGINSTQHFEIVDGNVDDVFMLEYEERNGDIYPDLKITKMLDYEQNSMYSLRIRAYDGGDPPRYGDLIVNITVEDVNDNQPTFDPTQYSANIPENATIGTSVVQVFATDQESGENGRISYRLTRRKESDDDFDIIEDTGELVVNRQLDYETEQSYELIVVAMDHGTPPLQSTAVVSVQIDNLNDNAPVIDIIYLNEDAPGRISEDASPGSFIAIISISDADMELNPEVNVTLEGDDENFGLSIQDNVMHLVIRSVDRERQQVYHLTVTATDTGNPPLSSKKTITLYISDTNDNPPVFGQETYEAEIEETVPPGSSVIQLTAYDRDEGNNSVITYRILPTPNTHSDWFQIDNYTGLITTRKRVDCETQSDPRLMVVAYDSGAPPQSATAMVNIHILNRNDNQPIFEQSFYSVEVNEDIATTTCILTVSATDLDCGQSESIEYSIVTPNAAAGLTMKSDTGQLCVVSPLDYERKRLYEFEIAATDQDGLFSTANVKVVVGDVNDNYPEFYPNEYHVNLARDSPLNSEVVVVQATDLDDGEFGEVTYRIVGGNNEGLFEISSESGAIRLVHLIPQSAETYTLTVEARDKGGLSSVISNARVEISILNSAQDLPQFSQGLYNFMVSEDTSVETVIGTVEATVQSGSVAYSIRSGDQNRLFKIHAESGQVKVGSSLDHDVIPFVLLNIQAGSGQPPKYGQAQVNITITDVNDNSPVFGMDEQEIMVREDHDLESFIYTAEASDIDSGANGMVTYSLQEDSDLFSISAQTGQLMLRSALDYESQRFHYVHILASDSGSPTRLTATLSLTVRVQDVNDNDPYFSQSVYSISVRESVGINTRFANVSAADSDSGPNGRLVYSLVPGAHSQTFGIFPNDGSIYNKVLLDRESVEQYSLEVVAQDEGNPPRSSSATVSITVLDTNDNSPQFLESSYSFFVEENKPEGKEIDRVSANDVDINDGPLQYAIDPMSNILAIDATSGMLSTKKQLDRELTESISVTVMVTDAGNPPRSSRVNVRVHILDENDNSPRFDSNEYSVKIEENEPKNTLVTIISASDLDKGENASITYSFSDDNAQYIFDRFQIIAQSGHILLQEPLDYEDRSQYLIRVVARDSGVPPRESRTVVNVTVMDQNEARPEFNHTQLSITVPENIPLYTEVGRVKAEDADRNDKITYYVIGGNMFGTFAVNASTGAIVVGRPVDYEQSSHHTIQIRALDSHATNPKSSIINVSITVEDVNDNPPKFEQDPIIVRIRENVPMGTTVHTYSAIDLDSGSRGQVRYEIVSQSPNKTWFRIEEYTGALISTMDIDYEQIKQISLVVKATDKPLNRSAELFTTVTTLVLVEDRNDNAPVFQSRDRVAVMEDEPVGFPVMVVVATDLDSGDNGNVGYLIVAGNEMGHFSIDSVTGLLTIAKALDRETTDLFQLRISARDRGHPKETTFMDVQVAIVDVNDNRPAFDQPVYRAEIYENEPVDKSLITLTATDRDIGVNAELKFLIPDGIVDGKFVIGLETGVIRTNASLDRERQDLYTLTAYVKDSAFPALYDTCTVTISVLDKNDNRPVFSEDTYELHVHENTALSALYTVIASDADTGGNGKVSYAITGGNSEQRFSIDPFSGQISCLPLDRETTSSYTLTIEARDGGLPMLKSTMTLIIEVLDENDNAPIFEQSEYSRQISEATSPGAEVLTVLATDIDAGDNANVTYSISNTQGGPTPFKVNNVTGVITTTGLLDRERQSNYNFSVHATDGGEFGPRSSAVDVYVALDDVNDNAPVFEKIPYSAAISHSTSVDTSVLTISATDVDSGNNGVVSYQLVGQSDYFELDSNTGVLTVKASLSNAPVFHGLRVESSDGGSPRLSTYGVVEITVGSNNEPALQFTSSAYNATISEDAPMDTEVTQVRATGRPDITYAFVSGNENDAFKITSAQGVIRVKDPSEVDYERTHVIRLIVEASAGSYKAYTTVYVHLEDANDNPPRFTQDRYVTAVDEGLNRGTYVTQLYATDLDSRATGNGRVIYEITNTGDVGGAFIIEPNYSGIVVTNALLDVETRRDYKLIVAAYDQGETVRLSSTCTLKIQVIDVNDNVPFFGIQPPRTIEEGVPLGTEVTTVTATDTDINVHLIYYFDENGNPGSMFSIDTYTGKITVARELDYEEQNKYDLIVKVSDVNHTATTNVQVNIKDINDNQPIFTQSSFQVDVDEATEAGVSILTVTATDSDAGENARITYSMISQPGFYIHPESGIIYTNRTVTYNKDNPTVNLVVMATDNGEQPFTAVVPVQIQVIDINNNRPTFTSQVYSETIDEDEQEGYIVVSAEAVDAYDTGDNGKIDYSIVSGNINNTFQIKNMNNNGAIYLVGPLDRERTSSYRLIVRATDRGEPPLSSTATVRITVKDVNDNAPVFNDSSYYATVAEDAPRDAPLLTVHADDADDGVYGNVQYQITSGNDYLNFGIDRESGVIFVHNRLDHETRSLHHLTVSAIDSMVNRPRHSAFVTVLVNVTDVNEYAPRFPVLMYFESVMEKMPIGTTVFTAEASDLDTGIYGVITYDIGDDENFEIDPNTGVVTTRRVFTYSANAQYMFSVKASDIDTESPRVPVIVKIEPNFVPQFIESRYSFSVRGDAKEGDLVGKVQVVNAEVDASDTSPAGVQFSFKNPTEYFTIHRTNGEIKVAKDLQSNDEEAKRKRRETRHFSRDRRALTDDEVTLIVVASVGYPPQTNEVSVVVAIDLGCNGCGREREKGGSTGEGGIGGTPLVIIIVFVVIAVILGIVILALFIRGRTQRARKHKQNSRFSSFNTIESVTAQNGYGGPPPYGDAQLYDHHMNGQLTNSDISAHSPVASSGRGSAEVDIEEDEEIRMINATPLDANDPRLPADSGMQDDDAMSEHSVKDHQEYLARLGIDTSKLKINETKAQSVESMHQFSDEGGGEGDGLDTFQYNAMPQESMAVMDSTPQFGFQEPAEQSTGGSLSSVINSEEEFSGSYNWDYLLDWGPQYQPLADVFTEIARLKDDSIKPKKAPTKIVPQTNGGFQNQQLRTSFPPPIITDAPPKGIELGQVGPSHFSSHSKPPHRERKDSSSSNMTVNSTRTSQLTSLSNLPKSPMSYESSFTTTPLSPDFENSLSPLQQHSPTFSPILTPGVGSVTHSTGHNTPQNKSTINLATGSSGSEQEIHI